MCVYAQVGRFCYFLLRQYFQGPDLPWTDVEVEEALASDLWKRNFSKRVFHTSEIRKARQSSHEQMQQHLLDASADIGSSNPSDLFSSRMDSIEAQRPDYDGSGPNLFGGHNSHNRSGFKPRYDAPLMSHVDVDYRNDLEPFKYPRRGESLMECTGDRGGDLGERFSGLEPTTYQDQVLRHIDNNVPQRQVPTKGEPSINERSTDLPAHRNFIRDIAEWRFQVPLG